MGLGLGVELHLGLKCFESEPELGLLWLVFIDMR